MKSNPVANKYVPCPKCGGANIKQVGFTWWGGILGPRLFSHVKCNTCGTTYNGKTGQSNTANILIYLAVTLAVVMALSGGGLIFQGGENPYRTPFDIRDMVLGLTFLIGMGAGAFVIIRKQKVAGLLTLAGFGLFSIDPIAEVVIFRIFGSGPGDDNYFITLNWAYACISTPAIFLGVVALLAALFSVVRIQTSGNTSSE